MPETMLTATLVVGLSFTGQPYLTPAEDMPIANESVCETTAKTLSSYFKTFYPEGASVFRCKNKASKTYFLIRNGTEYMVDPNEICE